ncbi:MAG: PKD domain-containing protein, partial [Prolixibacteraceae bacterium]|nr:PKD domain-containing protein [Prolixibacteraceae bacterium]
MILCVSVSWFKKIGWLILIFNLLLWAENANAQNLPPVLELGISNQHAEVGSAFSYTIPSNAFKDQNYDQITYSAVHPTWLSYDPATRTFSGTPVSAGNVTINVTASDGSLNGSTSFRITIHASGTYAAFTSNTQIGCNFRQVNFQNKSKGATTYFWDFGNGNTSTDANPQAIYNSPGTYTVTLTINGNPALTHSETISINSLPSPQIDADITTGCEPLNTQLNYSGSASGGTPEYYHWYFFEKHPEQFTFSPSVVLNGLVGGDYNAILRVTDANGCSGSTVFNKLFHVYEKPLTSFTYVKSNNCAPSVTTFTDQSELYDGNVSDYYWSVNGTSLSENSPEVSYDFAALGSGKHVVQLQTRSEHGCLSDVYTDTVYFNTSNTADFNVNSAYCLNDTLDLIAVTSAGATSFSWDFGNNGSIEATESSFSKTLTEPGTFPVKLAVDFNDGCRIEKIKDISIDRVDADFDYSSQYNCTSKVFTVSLNNTSDSFLNKNLTSLRWYLIDLSGSTLIGTSSSLQYTFNAEGTYTIRLDVVNEDGCFGSIAKSIQLNEPQAEITIDGNAYGCLSADAINFSASFSSQFDNAISYTWDFGDSGTANGQNVSHVYANSGSFDVSVTVFTNTGCSYTTTQLNAVQLANQPIINNMLALQPAGECFGSGLQLDVDYSSGVDLLSFTTPSGIENIDAPGASPYSFQYQFQHAGVYDFSVVASQYGCESEVFTLTGIEANEPEANFTPSQTSFCENPPYIVTFDNNSVYSDPATTFSWDFGDGELSTDFEPQHEYTETGNFNVTLTVSNPNTGCSDQHSVQLNVYSFDDATGIISADVTEGCAPLTVLLSQNISTRLSSNYQIDQLMWDFDNNGVIDSITSSSAPISFTYSKPGLYAVRLIATSVNGGCDYEFVENGLIKASGPTVNFSHSPLMVCKNTNVQFNSSVSKPSFDTANPALNVYSWNFGDGGNSNIENPEHTYTEESNFSVSLKVTDENNCSTTVVKTDLIKIIPFEVNFDLADSIFCNNSSIEIENTSTGEISSFLWDFDNNGTTDLVTYNTAPVTHNFVAAGNYTISLTAQVADGCTKTLTKNIRVINADADFSALSQNIGCAPGFAYFEAVADPNDVESYAWSFGNGNTSNESSPRNYYVTPGRYTVSLTIKFKGACSKTVTKPNYITADGAYGVFDFNKTLGCAPNPVLFSVSNMSRVDYINWDFGDGTVKRDTVPGSADYFETVYTYDTTGFRYPRVILTDEVCGDYTYINPDSIYTSLAPIPNFTTNYDSICRGVPIQFTDQTVSADPLYDVTAWKWHFGTTSLDSSSTQNPLFAYQNMGVYSPQLIVYNALGCSDTLTKKSSIHIYGNADLSADFEIGPSDRDTLACAWQNVNFYSKANAGNGTITDYKWDFGTALKTGENSQFAFADSLKGNNVTVTHIVIDDKLCIDSTSRTVAINNLQAAFGYDPQPVFRGSAVDFTDQSVPHSGQSISTWSWNFGNGQPISSPVQNPQNIAYNNIVDDNTVRLIVTDDRNCTDTSVVLFNVLNNPPILEPFTITLVENSNYIFRRADFENRFDANDPGQTITAVRVESAPGRGYFRLNGTIYTVGTIITIDQAALLEYVPTSNWFGNTDFTWNAFDGYSWSDNPELVNVIVLEIPDPPVLNDIVIDLPEDDVAKVGRQLFIDNTISVLGSSFDFDSLQILSAISPSAIGELFFNSNPFSGPYPYLILADQIDDASAVFEYYPENGFNGA